MTHQKFPKAIPNMRYTRQKTDKNLLEEHAGSCPAALVAFWLSIASNLHSMCCRPTRWH